MQTFCHVLCVSFDFSCPFFSHHENSQQQENKFTTQNTVIATVQNNLRNTVHKPWLIHKLGGGVCAPILPTSLSHHTSHCFFADYNRVLCHHQAVSLYNVSLKPFGVMTILKPCQNINAHKLWMCSVKPATGWEPMVQFSLPLYIFLRLAFDESNSS